MLRDTGIGIISLGLVVLLGACMAPANVPMQQTLEAQISLVTDAVACRRRVASQPRYWSLTAHMPLGSPFDGTMSQLTDSRVATQDEVVVLDAWFHDLQECRGRLARALLASAPTSIAIVLIYWNKEDEALATVAQRRMPWNKATFRRRVAAAELLTAQIAQSTELSAQLNAGRQAELSRRVALLNAFTNLAP